jgi:subtilase family serine protease
MLNALRFARYLAIVQVSILGLTLAHAQVGREPTRRLITQAIDDSKLVKLPGNTRSEANATNDRGPVPASLPVQHMQLLLRLPTEKEEELDKLLHEIQDPHSPSYHKWLTPEQFRLEFSLAPEDLQIIGGWLTSKGFSINLVGPRSIDFSGTAGQVRDAFETEIHYLDVRGVRHIANMGDPQIPAALAPAVAGIVSLNDFKPHPEKADH